VVTLGNGTALSDNYLKVTLAVPREANRIEEIRIGGLTSEGLCEAGVLPVLTSPAITARRPFLGRPAWYNPPPGGNHG